MTGLQFFYRIILPGTGVAATVATLFYGGSPAAKPIAELSCKATEGPVPLEVHCEATGSTNSHYFVWDFGNGEWFEGGQLLKSHTYREPGEYSIELTARGDGGASLPVTQLVKALAPEPEPEEVAPDGPALSPLVSLSLLAVTKTDLLMETKQHRVEGVFLDQPLDSKRAWDEQTRELAADEGYTIESAWFEEEDSNHATVRQEWQQGEAVATWTFELESSRRLFRHYSSWWLGTVNITQARTVPEQRVPLADGVDIVGPGMIPLDSWLGLDYVARLEVQDARGEVLASAPPGEALEIGSGEFVLNLTATEEGQLVLEVQRSSEDLALVPPTPFIGRSI